jgi:glycerophosphoryl diester phosphodiesterase
MHKREVTAVRLIALVFSCAAALIIAAMLYLMAPSRRRKSRMGVFEQYFIAHRGFHQNGTERPENSMPAFSAAVSRGYGIELDVQLTADGVPVVFHDFTLHRAAGDARRISELTFAELEEIPLFGSSQRIPRFSEVLRMVDGRVPMIIELKAMWKHRELCEKAARILDRYRGSYCIESFSPLALYWFRRHRPEVMRGQLATSLFREGKRRWWFFAWTLTWCLSNRLCRPDFVAYNFEFRNILPVRLMRRMYRCEMAAWTIRSQADLEKSRSHFDVFIFDSFDPKARSEQAG